MGTTNPIFDISQPVTAENLQKLVDRHSEAQHLQRQVGVWLAAQAAKSSVKEQKPAKSKKKDAA